MVTITDIWNLRTDPFYPEVDPGGHPIARSALERSLNPRVDERVLPLYYNLYDWQFSRLVGQLSRHKGLDRFPEARSLPSDMPFLILISGSGQTGLDSMANLVLHKIHMISRKEPLVCEVRLEDRNKARNAETVAREIIDSVEFPDPPFAAAPSALVKDMHARLEQERKTNEGRSDATYASVFSTFNRMMRQREYDIVIWIKKGGDHDSWATIQEAVAPLAPYVIVTTGDQLFAKSCYDAVVTRNQNVAWIRTSPLDEDRALEFVTERIAAARLAGGGQPGVDPAPFTRDAIAALYKPGTTAVEPLKHPVGWLRRTLHKALEDQVDRIAKEYPTVADLRKAEPEDIIINAERVREAQDSLNQGRR